MPIPPPPTIADSRTPLLSDNPMSEENNKNNPNPNPNRAPGSVNFAPPNLPSSPGSGPSNMRNTLDSWGEYAETKQSLSSRGELPPPDTSPTKGTEEENGNAFLRFRSDLEKTSKRISQKRLDALHQDAALSQAEKYGTDINSDEANGGQNPKIRRSRTEAANSASEAGVNHKLIAGSANSQPAPRSSRRKSLVKQDATLEYFRDRRPNKHSGYRRAVTNVQNVFVMR